MKLYRVYFYFILGLFFFDTLQIVGLREDKKAQARQRISSAATALFLKKGFDAVSVADVAAAANVSKMTVFNYFPRKEDLLLDRNEEALALVRSAILERAKGQSAVDAFFALARRLVNDAHPFAKWTPATEHFFGTIRESPSLNARVRELRELMETELTNALVESAIAHAPANDATAHVLAVAMVAAWRVAHTAATAAYREGERGTALSKRFLLTLKAALEPVRRAARGTPYGGR
ncbi:MAG: TetR/AcrR family transcriptional regulator [Myxococcales bacterium]|nr:MAG: TetR/AcrR family transcriptional regulator [Myxococcales bacterium]